MDPNIQVQELESMETIEITGRFRIITFEMVACEEIDYPSTLESDNEEG